MKKFDLAQSVSLLANLGVLLGIVFLAIEINESNRQARVASTTTLIGQTIDIKLSIANDTDSSSVFARGMNSFQELADEDKVRFDLIMQAMIDQYGATLATESFGLGVNAQGFLAGKLAIHFENEGFRQWWAQKDRREFPQPVVRFIESVEAAARERQ